MLKNFQTLPVIKSSVPCTVTTPANSLAGNNVISNYPNPFQGSTTINYISQGGHALVQIFDNQGKMIRTLVDSDTNQGAYSITFDNNGSHPPGTYYARLQNGSIQQVRTMMMMR